MLRLRRKLQARVPNKLAAICAVALFVSSLGGMDESIFARTLVPDFDSSAVHGPRVELAGNALPNLPTTKVRNHKISLMIFRLR